MQAILLMAIAMDRDRIYFLIRQIGLFEQNTEQNFGLYQMAKKLVTLMMNSNRIAR